MASTETSSLVWTSPEPGVYRREADALESQFASMHDLGAPLGKQHWVINSAIKVSFPANITQATPYIKAAWLAIRRLHPVLGATISAADPAKPSLTGRTITVPALNEDAFLQNSFFVHEEDVEDATELAAGMMAKDAGTMHWLPETSEVFLHIGHWQVDGVGTVMLWSNFLDCLATLLKQGPEKPPEKESVLTQCVGLHTKTPMYEETTPQYLKDAVDCLLGTFIKGVPGIGPPLKAGSEKGAVPAQTKCRRITLDEASTKAVITACQGRNWSVSAVAQAAIIKALARYTQHPMAKHFSTLVPVSLRQFLPAPYDGPQHAAGCIVSGWPLLVEDVSDKTFEEIANIANEVFRKDFTKTTKNDQGGDVGLIDYSGPYARRTMQLFTATPPPELPPRTTPSMSSLGVIEKYVQREYPIDGTEKLIVDDFSLSLEMLGQDQFIHIWTFRDQLKLQVSANSTFFDEQALDDELEGIKKEMLLGLGVK